MIIVKGTDYLTIAGSPAASYDFGGEIGEVPLMMKPVGPGNTNTIRRRLRNAHLPTPGSSESIDFEVVLISTINEEPFTINGEPHNLFLRVTPGEPSIGSMVITRSENPDELGGTFTSSVLCFFTADFTPVDESRPGFSVRSNIVLETQTPGVWQTTPPDGAVLVRGEVGDSLANLHTKLPMGAYDFFMVGSVFDGLQSRGGHVMAAGAVAAGEPRTYDSKTLSPLDDQ